jgi:hypothetical protein
MEALKVMGKISFSLKKDDFTRFEVSVFHVHVLGFEWCVVKKSFGGVWIVFGGDSPSESAIFALFHPGDRP